MWVRKEQLQMIKYRKLLNKVLIDNEVIKLDIESDLSKRELKNDIKLFYKRLKQIKESLIIIRRQML